jgi:hypothetical protein
MGKERVHIHVWEIKKIKRENTRENERERERSYF